MTSAWCDYHSLRKQDKMRQYNGICYSKQWYYKKHYWLHKPTQVWDMSTAKEICSCTGQWTFRSHTLQQLKIEKQANAFCDMLLHRAWLLQLPVHVWCSLTMCFAALPQGPVLRTWWPSEGKVKQ